MIFIPSDFHNNFSLAYTWTRLKNLEQMCHHQLSSPSLLTLFH